MNFINGEITITSFWKSSGYLKGQRINSVIVSTSEHYGSKFTLVKSCRIVSFRFMENVAHNSDC